jgi:hypothetical protein
MKDDITKILKLGVRAPSGDNSQPWRFEVVDNEIFLYGVPSRDTSLFNYNNIAIYIALGAVIENIKIASSHFGYSCNINLFPNGFDNPEHFVAKIILDKNKVKKDKLFSAIKERTNNRKPYSIKKIDSKKIENIKKHADLIEGIGLKIVEDKYKINNIAAAGSTNEKIVLRNKKLHNFFFSHIVWSEKEAKRLGEGMSVSSLEMPKPAEVVFSKCKNWNFVSKISKIGFPSLVAKQNQQLYMRAGAYGAIILEKDDPIIMIEAGRLIERVWLQATLDNLSFNVMAGIPLLAYRIMTDDSGELNEKEIKLIENSYKEICNSFEIDCGFTPFLFRLGLSKPPREKTYRLPLEKVVVFK